MAAREYIVAVDSREQLPYSWGREGVQCRTVTLEAGDYSIIGMERVVCVERKSFADFYSCLTEPRQRNGTVKHGRERFENDLHRMSQCRYPLVVIEATMSDLLRRFTYVASGGVEKQSQLDPLVAQNSWLSWQARYRIPMPLCGERSAASRMTLQHLDLVWRLEREDAKQVAREANDEARASGAPSLVAHDTPVVEGDT